MPIQSQPIPTSQRRGKCWIEGCAQPASMKIAIAGPATWIPVCTYHYQVADHADGGCAVRGCAQRPTRVLSLTPAAPLALCLVHYTLLSDSWDKNVEDTLAEAGTLLWPQLPADERAQRVARLESQVEHLRQAG